MPSVTAATSNASWTAGPGRTVPVSPITVRCPSRCRMYVTEKTNPSQGSRRAASVISSGGIVCDVRTDDERAETRTCFRSAPPSAVALRIMKASPVSLRARQGNVHDVLGDEPYLQLVGTDHVADNQIVRAVVAVLGRQPCHGARFLENDLVRVQKTRNLHRCFFAALGRPWNKRHLGDVGRHRNADAAEQLNAFGDFVNQPVLLLVVL